MCWLVEFRWSSSQLEWVSSHVWLPLLRQPFCDSFNLQWQPFYCVRIRKSPTGSKRFKTLALERNWSPHSTPDLVTSTKESGKFVGQTGLSCFGAFRDEISRQCYHPCFLHIRISAHLASSERRKLASALATWPPNPLAEITQFPIFPCPLHDSLPSSISPWLCLSWNMLSLQFGRQYVNSASVGSKLYLLESKC